MVTELTQRSMIAHVIASYLCGIIYLLCWRMIGGNPGVIAGVLPYAPLWIPWILAMFVSTLIDHRVPPIVSSFVTIHPGRSLFIMLSYAAIFGVGFRVVGRKSLAARREMAGLCPACGYDLRATADRCPECGQVRGQRR